VVDADCVWTLDSGSSYATIGSATGVLSAGVPTSPVPVVIRATCTYNGSVKSATKVVSVQAAISLATALDNTRLSFVTDGDAPWYGQSPKSYDGTDAAQSGAVGNGQKSWMETTVTGPGTLSFRYLVSSEENYDKFIFMHNGNAVHVESGIHTAKSLGVPVDFLIPASMVMCALISSVAVAFVGCINFIGLIAAHIMRRFVGNDFRFLIPCTALAGSILLLASDITCRMLVQPIVLPIGALTSFLGGPLFLWLIMRRRRFK
jgi:hypothetical protein